MDLKSAKAQLRKTASKARKDAASLAAQAGQNVSLEIALRLQSTDFLQNGLVISGFLPIGSEIDTRPILEICREMGLEITLPCVEQEAAPLIFRRWHPDDTLVKESFGTVAPAASAQELLPDLIIAPMLAFDRRGYRLGYGGGFYDRSLEKIRKIKPVRVIGVAYAAQEVEAVPIDEFDQPLDMVVTEREVINL